MVCGTGKTILLSRAGIPTLICQLFHIPFTGEFTFKSSAYSDVEKRKTVELALFLDHKAYSHFHLLYDKDEIVEAVLASANQLSAIYHMPSLGQIVDFSIVKLEVHEDEEPFENHEGERRRFLESFCE